MHISDALIDAASGSIIVPGYIQLSGPIPGTSETVDCEHLLLDFSDFRLECRRVISYQRISSGLARVCTDSFSFKFVDLTRRCLDNLFRWESGPNARNVRFAGGRCGSLTMHKGVSASEVGIVTSIEAVQALDIEGRTIILEGEITPRTLPNDAQDAKLRPISFRIRGVLPWATVRLFGFAGSNHSHLYTPKTMAARPNVSASPVPCVVSSLEELRSLGLTLGLERAKSGSDMLLAGTIELTSAGKATRTPAMQTVVCNFSEINLTIGDADDAILHSDGFCSSGAQAFRFHFTCLNAPFLDRLLGEDGSHATATMSGSTLGRLHYETGLGSHGDPLQSLRQDVEHLEVTLNATESGIDLSLVGRLYAFPEEYVRDFCAIYQKRIGKSSEGSPGKAFEELMRPWSGYCIKLSLPWMWLLIRHSPCAKRMKRIPPE